MRDSFRTILLGLTIGATMALLLPVGANAAGTLMTIVDPDSNSKAQVDAGRLRVGDGDGPLNVEQRAGVHTGAFAEESSRSSVGWMLLVEAQRPQKIALTELSITGEGPAGSQHYRIEAWLREGTTGSCAQPNLTDFTKVVLRRVAVPNNQTLTLDFSGTPLYVPRAPDTTCLGVVSVQAPTGSTSYVGATGYTFVP